MLGLEEVPVSEGSFHEALSGTADWAVIECDCLGALAALPEKCGVVVTDVPYNCKKSFANDDMPWAEFLPWLDARLAECVRVGRLAFSFWPKTKLVKFIR